MTLHNWVFVQKRFGEHLGKEDGPDGKLMEETTARTGANIIGRRMFKEGTPNLDRKFIESRFVYFNPG